MIAGQTEHIYIESGSLEDCRRIAKEFFKVDKEVLCEKIPVCGSEMYFFFGFGVRVKEMRL